MRYSLASKIRYFLSDNKVTELNLFMPSAETAGLVTTKTARRRGAFHEIFLGSQTPDNYDVVFQCRRNFGQWKFWHTSTTVPAKSDCPDD